MDAVYIATPHLCHYNQCLQAMHQKKHVLCETPLVLKMQQARELYETAEKKGIVLMEANKTAFAPAFCHLITMIKSGMIGEVVDINVSESKLWGDRFTRELEASQAGGSMTELASYPLLPIVKLMGTDYLDVNFYSRMKISIRRES